MLTAGSLAALKKGLVLTALRMPFSLGAVIPFLGNLSADEMDIFFSTVTYLGIICHLENLGTPSCPRVNCLVRIMVAGWAGRWGGGRRQPAAEPLAPWGVRQGASSSQRKPYVTGSVTSGGSALRMQELVYCRGQPRKEGSRGLDHGWKGTESRGDRGGG